MIIVTILTNTYYGNKALKIAMGSDVTGYRFKQPDSRIYHFTLLQLSARTLHGKIKCNSLLRSFSSVESLFNLNIHNVFTNFKV